MQGWNKKRKKDRFFLQEIIFFETNLSFFELFQKEK